MDQLDICSTFGPMASMHAALDAAGCGMPCAVSARYEGLEPSALEQHLVAAAAQFPVLGARLVWMGERPTLQAGTGAPIAASAPLDFSAVDAPLTWRAIVWPAERGAGLTAVFSHAMADGASMLRLVSEIERRLGRNDLPAPPGRSAHSRRPAALPWLSDFLIEQQRPHLAPWPDRGGPMGASWFRISPDERDRVIARARSACGRVVPFLAAAAALAAAELAASGRRRVSLNIPIARPGGHAFGFGVGSLLFGQEVTSSLDTADLARRLAARIAPMSAKGWDGGLDWFLGPNPRRHRSFARIRARSPADPAINVSWKGFHRRLGGPGGALDVACFAAAPTAHVSAHADLGGLSISLTAPRPPAAREAFLQVLAKRLGLDGEPSLRTYVDAPNCSAASSA